MILFMQNYAIIFTGIFNIYYFVYRSQSICFILIVLLSFFSQKISDSASLIGATCDTFINTLEDCMKLIANTPMFESHHQHVRDAAIPSSPTRANTQRLPVGVNSECSCFRVIAILHAKKKLGIH